MRKNKGYQLDVHKSYRGKKSVFSWAGGKNKTPEQVLDEVNKAFDERIKTCKKEYEKISKWTTLIGEDLCKACRDHMYWEVKFDKDYNLIPLEKQLKILEDYRHSCLSGKLYGKWGAYQKRIINKDNQKFVYNSGSGADGSRNWVRIPSIKRSNATWKRFYELFPYYKEHYNELNNKNGIKLKKVW